MDTNTTSQRNCDLIQVLINMQQQGESSPSQNTPYYFGPVENGTLTDNPVMVDEGPPYYCC